MEPMKALMLSYVAILTVVILAIFDHAMNAESYERSIAEGVKAGDCGVRWNITNQSGNGTWELEPKNLTEIGKDSMRSRCLYVCV